MLLVDKNRDYSQVLEERVNNGLTAGYVYGLDLISQQRGSEKSFYLVDGLGSTRGLTNGSGNVTDTYAYDAFGNLISSTNNVQNNYLFAGEQFDKSLGDYYLRARYYDAETGRFTRRDSYEGRRAEPITLHKYLYANADPVNNIDPTGYSTLSIRENLDVIAIVTALASLYLSSPVPGLTTKHDREDFLEWYIPYYAASSTDGDIAIEKLKEKATPTDTTGKKSKKSKEYEKEGDANTANDDFDEIVKEWGKEGEVKDYGGGKRSVELPDGSTVSVRPNSTDGAPTIQVDRPTSRVHTKFRYKQPSP